MFLLMPILFLQLIIISPAIAEQEFQGETKQISQKYYDGQYLIYDCAKHHWTCVDLDGFKECQEERSKAGKDYKRNLACAPFKEFKTKKECEVFQQKKVNNPEGKKFCQHTLIKNGTTR